MRTRVLTRYSAVLHTPEDHTRVGENELGPGIWDVQVALGEYDRAHPGTLPDLVDMTIVFRSTSTRVYLATATADIDLPAHVFASVPALPVAQRSVALTIALARDFDHPDAPHDPLWLPCSWRAAVAAGRSIDDLLDEVSPT